MNGRCILFSAIVNAVIGAVLGLILAKLKPQLYPTRSEHSPPIRTILVGMAIGGMFGATVESVRELKKQQDREENLRNYLQTYLSLRDMDRK
ncbi:MAG: hypothetical protein MUF72_05660 [Elainella sp. Prado103]|jgi:ABC-type Fe3+-siderophore transport system permease subunit|nr:hypothetical protein [Elainella sp. Prado103]